MITTQQGRGDRDGNNWPSFTCASMKTLLYRGIRGRGPRMPAKKTESTTLICASAPKLPPRRDSRTSRSVTPPQFIRFAVSG